MSPRWAGLEPAYGTSRTKTMNKMYELTVLLPLDSTEKSANALIEGLLKKSGGKIASVDFWGKRDMAYPIKKNTQAIYVLFNLEMEPPQVSELEKRLRIDENVIRYLIVVAQKPVISQKQEKGNGSKKSK